MEKAELLTDFKAKVDAFAKYQGFIDKTLQQADKFAKSVVEKVITDNTARRDEVVADLIPLMADIDDVVAGLEGNKRTLLEGQKDQRMQLEEMELRKMIGEITDEQFEKESADLQAELSKVDESTKAIDDELAVFNAEMERWRGIGAAAGVLAEPSEEAGAGARQEVYDEPEEEEEVEFVSIDGDLDADEPVRVESVDILEPDIDASDDVDVSAFAEEASEPEGVRFAAGGSVEDMSVVFEEDDDDDDDDGDDELEIEGNEVDSVADDDVESIEGAEERPRRAVMLYQEGTAEEQIHPFTGEQLTLGRGRDNDIQVKNDSKVSRYHCKLYRKNGNFYIEDNKSANGSLVNGELITERRLFGGEEIIIGETFFRFRIMD